MSRTLTEPRDPEASIRWTIAELLVRGEPEEEEPEDEDDAEDEKETDEEEEDDEGYSE